MQEIMIDTPLGQMVAVFSEDGLCLLEFADQTQLVRELSAVHAARKGRLQVKADDVAILHDELANYFSGSLKTFRTRLDPIGTLFQQRVWQILQYIPYGKTWTYLQQAQAMGNAKAVRAVAAANGQNKISIIIPCHRVIGSNGKLIGYAGGLSRKQYLIDLENSSVK